MAVADHRAPLAASESVLPPLFAAIDSTPTAVEWSAGPNNDIMLDPTTVDLIEAAYWPGAFVVVVGGGMILFCRSIANRIQHAKIFDWSKKSAEFYESQSAAQVSIGESSPEVASATPPPPGTFDAARAKRAVQSLATGWRFERYLRIIYPAQLELLMALKGGAVFTDAEAHVYYDKLPPDYKVNVTYVAFIEFLIVQGLIHNELTAAGEGRYTITLVGSKFLEFRDQIANGVVYPEMNIFDTPQLTG